MEAGAVPRVASPRVPALSPRLIRLASDARLVALVREGRAGALEALYDRHHRGILAFCRHMLADRHEAEDAVQHTFMAAYSSLLASRQPIHLRPWLFAIARNRCCSVLRSQRERPAADIEELVTDGLAVEVQRRQDLRDLVTDLGRLPDDQREAIVLAELEALSHAEIAHVLSVPREKVKALVFQARESLMASRTARDTTCHEIRQQLAVGQAGTLRRSNLRRHLRDCEGCRAYRAEVQRQRRQFAVLLPVAPTLLLKEGLLVAAVGAGGAAAVGGSGLIAASALKTGFLKGVAAAVIAGAGTLGTVVVSASDLPIRSVAIGPAGSVAHVRPHHQIQAPSPPRPEAQAPRAHAPATITANHVLGASRVGAENRTAESARHRHVGRTGARHDRLLVRSHRHRAVRAHGHTRVTGWGQPGQPGPPGQTTTYAAQPATARAAPHLGSLPAGRGHHGGSHGGSGRGPNGAPRVAQIPPGLTRQGRHAPPGWVGGHGHGAFASAAHGGWGTPSGHHRASHRPHSGARGWGHH